MPPAEASVRDFTTGDPSRGDGGHLGGSGPDEVLASELQDRAGLTTGEVQDVLAGERAVHDHAELAGQACRWNGLTQVLGELRRPRLGGGPDLLRAPGRSEPF